MAKEDKQKKFLTFRSNKDNKYEPMAPSNSTPASTAATQPPPVMNQLDVDSLRQGQLYLIRGRMVKLALFEGWNDDACLVFSLLREEATPMSWSEVKYLAGDFDVFEAFDSDGNPPIYVWKRALGTDLPHHWFRMFEEARRRQADWMAVYGEDMNDNELSGQPVTLSATNPIEVSNAQAHRDGTSSPLPDRENLRAFIAGSATEPTSGNGTVNSSSAKFESKGDDKGSKKGGKKARKALAGIF